MNRIPDSCPDDLKAKIDEVVNDVYRRLRPGLTDVQRAEAERIGRLQYVSAGATRKR